MTKKTATLLLSIALLLAIVPGSAWALCGAVVERGCCSVGGGGCPMGSPDGSVPGDCCEIEPASETQPVVAKALPTLPSMVQTNCLSSGSLRTVDARSSNEPDGAPLENHVPLYTLHTALLI